VLNRILTCLLLSVAGVHISAVGQTTTNSAFNLTLVPGISSVGLDPSNNYSYLTLNILTGYQRGTYFFELSTLSSANIQQVNGIQIAGLVNMVGIDYYRDLTPKEALKAENAGDVPFLNGIQVSGLMNYVRGNSAGAQLSLGFNISKFMMTGTQIGGMLNYSSKLLTGAQLALIGNISNGTTLGVQVGGFNKTSDELSGIQVGTVNLAHNIEGKNSIIETESTGLQIGLVNYSKIMNGFQVGLINLSGQNQGTQIGLINIYRPARKKGKLDGTPIGLLNFGSSISLEAFVDETFQMNYGLSTGNIKNSGRLPANKIIYIMNQLLFRQSHFSKNEYRAYGWNWQKQFYNYSPDIMGEFYFFSIGAGISYVDFKATGDKANLLTELGLTFGSRIFPKNRSIYLFATVDANYFYSDDGQTLGPEKLTFPQESNIVRNTHEFWPGISAGVKIK
jgi:hypothetical protein